MTQAQHPAFSLPFPALVGLETAQQALLLLAIDPGLQGVVLAASAGTGKSSLARGARALLGDQTPFVELPPSTDIENLLGGLDLEATLRTGQIVMQRGVLARAHGGMVYVDGINLLTDGTANLLLSVLDEGTLRIEREGVSRSERARFSLIGSYDPQEGLPRRHLLDRIGLIVPIPPASDPEARAEVIRNNLRANAAQWDEDTEFLRGLVATAREHLPHVRISAAQIHQLSTVALAYGVEGHRVDLFAVRAACAAAAYNLVDEVGEEDLRLAVQLVILPRATRIPAPMDEQQGQNQPPPQQPTDNTPDAPDQNTDQPDDSDDQQENADSAPPDALVPPPEQILEALEADLPDDFEQLPFQQLRRGRSGSRGSTEGTRGRHVRSIPGDPRRQRLDVVATLRAAAPWQALRKRSKRGKRRIRLQMGDVRVKQYRSKAGALFCFAVDASGSMAIHRMRQAKGAVNTLLMQAYVNRDRVALISFRGEQAELLLPPTQSAELARRALDLLPTGGGTPLASALLLALEVAQQARGKGILQTVLVLLTDGRANVGLKPEGDVNAELQQLGRFVAESSLHVVVVDTKRNYLSRGEARQLADWLGATYAYLPNASGEQIGELVAGLPE